MSSVEPLHSRELAREREREREKGTQALMEQRCFNQHGVGIYTVLQGSYSSAKIKILPVKHKKEQCQTPQRYKQISTVFKTKLI